MRIKCYIDGDDSNPKEYDAKSDSFADIAARYIEECHASAIGSHDVIVEPAYDEAKAMVTWHEDGDGPPFRMFVVVAAVAWTGREVKTFNRSAA